MTRHWIAPLLLAVLLVGFTPKSFAAPAEQQAMTVAVDRGVTLTLSAPATSVFIANPDVADVQVLSPTSVMVFGKRTGQTTMVAADGNGKTLLHRTVVVAQDLTDLRVALNAVIPGSKIKAEAVPNGIVLTGEAKDPSIAEDARRLAMRYVPKDGEIINRIKIKGSNQIQIRVRFAEVSRDVDKRFGIDWESLGSVGGFTFGLATGNPVFTGTMTQSVTSGRVIQRTNVGSNTNDSLFAGHTGKRWDINGMIDALAVDGFVTLLAEPSLTAMSGETASFLAGGEFPVPVPQGQNNVTIMFRQYGVSLAFTPTIVGDDRINLHVKPEVSQLTDTGSVTIDSITVPGLATRRAETTIELGSGQSFAIAGLLNNNQQDAVSKFPLLGDMPILGQLFRSTRFQNSESELVIIITPYIVKPSNDELSLPTDGYSMPSDNDRLVKFRHSNSDPAARPLSGVPTAAKIDPQDAVSKLPEDEPVPQAAPVAPVMPAAPVVPVESTPAKTAPAPVHSDRSGPAGPGGFILE